MATLFKTLKEDWSISATVAGFLAVLISYSGPLIIFFQAAQQAQVSPAMMISWIWGISIGAAVAGIFLSIKFSPCDYSMVCTRYGFIGHAVPEY
jgi:benzoate membrane transport protein